MKKIIIIAALLVLCLSWTLLSAAAAEPEYETTVTVEGGTVEALQAKMDGLTYPAGDVRIILPNRLFSYVQRGTVLSVPTDKGITSLTLSHEGEGMAYISISKTTSHIGNPDFFYFFANGIPLIIDEGVTFGTPHSVTGPGMTNMDYYQGEIALFGGGQNEDIVGDTSITINEGGGVNAAIYGGGLNGKVTGNTTITAHGGYGEIYGGGYALPAAGSGDICADVTGKATIAVDNTVAPKRKSDPGENRINSWYNGSIHGGGKVVLGFLDVIETRSFSARVQGGVFIDVNCIVSSAEIFGGGSVVSKGTGGHVALNADVTDDVKIHIGERTQQAAEFGTPESRYPFSVLGSGYVYRQSSDCADNASAQVYGDVTITAVESAAAAGGEGGICSILGGGATENGGANCNVTVNGNVTIETARKTLPFKAVGGVYNNVGVAGGGYSSGGSANVTQNVNIHVCKAPDQSGDYQNVKNVVGGGVAGGEGTANVGGSVSIRIDDGIRFDGTAIDGIDRMGVTGGGWVKAKNGVADVAGAVDITVGSGAVFNGTYRITGGGWVTGWYGTADVAGVVTTTIGDDAAFNDDCRIIGGGWASDWYGTASVAGTVTTIGDRASFNGTYRIVGGGWAGNGNEKKEDQGPYGAEAHVTGDVKTQIGKDAGFAGGYLPGKEGADNKSDYKLGIIGGGWVTMDYGFADVTGTVTTVIGENAAFQNTCRVVGGGAKDGWFEYYTTATTGKITVTLNGTAGDTALEELFCGSLEGRDPSAPATITLRDCHVGYLHDKGNECPSPVDVTFLGQGQIDWAQLYGWNREDPTKRYQIKIGDGETPTQLILGGGFDAQYGPSYEVIDFHIFRNASFGRVTDGPLCIGGDQDVHNLTIDKGGTLEIRADEWISGSFTGGGTLALLKEDVRLRMLSADAIFTGTVKAKVTEAREGQVIATTRKDGTQGSFVYDGAGFSIEKREVGDNYDWYLVKRELPPVVVTTYTFTASAGAGGTVSPAGQVSVRQGEDVTFTITPDEGYVIADVLVDGVSVGAVEEYTFEKVTKAHTVQAVFKEKPGSWITCPQDVTCPIHNYYDTDPMAWYHSGVHYCLETGLMQGYGHGRFGPDNTLTRAQLAQILYNLAGRPSVSGSSFFVDVAPGTWYADAVNWAASGGIVLGYGNGRFGPEDNITREQLAAMLWRYAEATGQDMSAGEGTNLHSFTDFAAISAWALPALQWSVGSGLVKGKGNDVLDPIGQATRAEAAVMIRRFADIESQMPRE